MIGADQGAMDLLSRMVVERLSNLGKTFRLLIDGFSHKMSSEVCPLPFFFRFLGPLCIV
jgi:hypothetical protein